MSKITRRSFLGAAGAAMAYSSVVGRSLRAATGVAKPVIGFIGCGGRSKSLLGSFAP